MHSSWIRVAPILALGLACAQPEPLAEAEPPSAEELFQQGLEKLEGRDLLFWRHKNFQSAIDTFQDVNDHTSNQLTESVNSANESLTSGLDDGLSNIMSGLGDVGGLIEEAFNLFNGGFDELGQKLMDMGTEIFSNAVEHLQEELMETLKESFENMIQQVIQGLIEQIIESIAMMTIGQTITAALGAYTPLLVIAKNVVSVINDLLDALNLGL